MEDKRIFLTIFTPTFNRAYILSQLYNSLITQTSQNFEWVIVDDGSTDETEDLVMEWIKASPFTIKYHKQANQGKHIAINTGSEIASGELFFIVDSDDALKPNAVKAIADFWKSNNDNTLSGIIGYREFFDGAIVGSKLPPYIKRCKLRDCKRLGSEGDKVVIYRTSVIRHYKYPKFDNEKFLGESYVFNQIDDKYDMLVMNERVYLFAYQKDGLSQDFRKLYRNNPLGFKVCYEQNYSYAKDILSKVRILSNLWCIGFATNKYSRILKSPFGYLSYPLGIFLYFKIFMLKLKDVKPYEQSAER